MQQQSEELHGCWKQGQTVTRCTREPGRPGSTERRVGAAQTSSSGEGRDSALVTFCGLNMLNGPMLLSHEVLSSVLAFIQSRGTSCSFTVE